MNSRLRFRHRSGGLLNLLTLSLVLLPGVVDQIMAVTADRVTLRKEPEAGFITQSGTGDAVAVSERWILLGQPDQNRGLVAQGAVQVHRARDGEFVRTLLPTVAFQGAKFGASVSICGDIAVIGASGEQAGDGAVYLFNLKTGAQLSRISSPVASGEFGTAVATSGTLAVVGAPGANSGAGVFYLFDVEAVVDGVAVFLAPISPQGVAAGDRVGRSVAIYDQLVLIGSPGDDGGEGAAYLFNVQGDELQKFTAFVETPGDLFGLSVALNGSRALIGAPGASGTAGKALIMEVRYGLGLRAELTGSGGAGTFFGNSVALTEDLAFVGSVASTSVAAFRAADGSLVAPVFGSNEISQLSDQFGFAVAAEGNRLVVGAPNAASGEGLAFFFPQFSEVFPGSIKAATGDAAVGIANSRIRRFAEAGLNPMSLEVGYRTFLAGAGAARGRNQAVTAELSGAPITLAGQRLNDDSTGLFPLLSLEKPNANIASMVFYCGRIRGGGKGVFRRTVAQGTQVVLQTGQRVGPLAAESIQQFSVPLISPSGNWVAPIRMRRSAAAGVSAANDSGFLSLDPDGVVRGLLREGATAPGMAGGVTNGPLNRGAFFGPELIFLNPLRGTSPRENQAISWWNPFTLVSGAVAQKGVTLVPNTASDTFRTFLGEAAAPEVANALFRAVLSPSPTVNGRNNQGIYRENFGSLVEVARKGNAVAPLGPNVFFARFLNVWGVAETGNPLPVFTAKLRGQGVTPANDCGLFSVDENQQTRVLLREGEPLPGTCSGERVGRILRADVNPKTGLYALLVSIAGAPGGTNLALLMGDCSHRFNQPGANATRRPWVVLRKGRSHQEAFGDTTRLASMGLPSLSTDRTGMGGKGYPQSLGNFEMLVTVLFNNRKSAIATINSF